jgi:hypothetical protein
MAPCVRNFGTRCRWVGRPPLPIRLRGRRSRYPLSSVSGLAPVGDRTTISRSSSPEPSKIMYLCDWMEEHWDDRNVVFLFFLVWITFFFWLVLFMSPSPNFSWLSIIRGANKTKILYPRDLRIFPPCCDWRSRDSSVGIVIRLWARLPRSHGSIPCGDIIFVSSPERPNRFWGWLIPLFNGYCHLYTAGGGKWPLTFVGCWG